MIITMFLTDSPKNVEAQLLSSKPVIATLAKKGHGLIEKARQWPASELWELIYVNRDMRVTEVVTWLNSYC